MNREPRVIVIGAGPCGLFSGLLLARFGVPTLILDARESAQVHPRAMGITRRTAELYRQCGLLERMMEQDLPVDRLSLSICMHSLAGEEFGRTALTERISEHTPCAAFHSPQPHTEAILLEALEKEPLAEVRYGVTVTQVVELPNEGAKITMQTAKGERSDIRPPWVIAADGAGSTVRHLMGIDASGPGDMGHFLNVYFKADYGSRLRDRKSILYHCVSTEYAEFFVSVNGEDLWLMHHYLMPNETLEDYPEEKLLQLIRQASGFEDIQPQILSVNKWVMSPKIAENFRHGRIFLTGDAAAKLSPAGGLGMNTGLQSAHNLAWKLAMVIQSNADENLLDTYEMERRTLSLHLMQSTNKNSIEVYDIVEAALAGDFDTVRKLAANSRRAGSRLGLELGFSYSEGAFLPDGTALPSPADPENDYTPDARPGGRAPHLPIKTSGTENSLLDFFGKDWVLLTGPDGSAWENAAKACTAPKVMCKRAGKEFTADENAFLKIYGIQKNGAVLVRPDGIVAFRAASTPENTVRYLKESLKKILRAA